MLSGQWRSCPKGKEQAAELEAGQVVIVGQTDAEVSLPTY